MSTPPDFGGRSIEEGREEELGLHPEHHGREPADSELPGQDPADLAGNEAHAPGATCARCGQLIEAGQDVRRRADGQWVHEACPQP